MAVKIDRFQKFIEDFAGGTAKGTAGLGLVSSGGFADEDDFSKVTAFANDRIVVVLLAIFVKRRVGEMENFVFDFF